MSTDLDDQLAAYGSWLRRTTGAALTPSDRSVDKTGSNRGDHHGPHRRPGFANTWLQVAAALIVLVGVGGLVVAQRESDPPPATEKYSVPIDL